MIYNKVVAPYLLLILYTLINCVKKIYNLYIYGVVGPGTSSDYLVLIRYKQLGIYRHPLFGTLAI